MKLQRDQVVAAGLVGTVVVVLGFASGIGGVPVAQSGPTPPVQHLPAATTTPPARPQQPPPQQQQVVPAAVPLPVPQGPHVPAPAVEHPHPAPTSPPSKPTVPPTTTPPSKPCEGGAVTELLKLLDLDALPVVGELLPGTHEVERESTVDLPLLGKLGDPAKLVGDLTGDLLGPGCSLVADDKTGKITALLSTP
ncbi:hypothetical protein [Lentzea kentuckyensis]|uniref:hypothetical protein n=1 Tax=Lentzea kentuckyensis TaxID=360086 RepID=UPI000A392BAB|nr:hypothetical protein [Lentzea kentuckyensis]